MKTNFPAYAAALSVWLVPLCVALLGADQEGQSAWPAVLCGWLFIASILCVFFREKSWIIALWVPVVGLSLIAMAALLIAFGGIGGGGASAGPVGGDVVFIFFGIFLLLAILVVSAFWFHPKVSSGPIIVVFTVLNTLAAGITTTSATRHVSRMDILVRLLDREGKPIAGASVRYERFGYGSEGRTVRDERGGPIFSGEDGIAVIPSLQMRYETHATISKEGYRDLTFKLGMQFRPYDRARDVTLSTPKSAFIANGTVAADNPVQITLYIPRAAERLGTETKRIELYSKSDVGEQSARYLNVSSGKFTSETPTDLKLELSPANNGNFANRRLHLTGLNGLELQMIRAELHFDGVSSTYEQIYGIAPTEGYQSEITLEGESYTRPGVIYMRSADRTVSYRLRLEYFGDATGQVARYSGELFISSSGLRHLQ